MNWVFRNTIIDEIKENLLSIMKQNKKSPELFIEAMKASGEDNNAKLIAAYLPTSWSGSTLCESKGCRAFCDR